MTIQPHRSLLTDELSEELYDTLRRLAASQLKDERKGGTLQPTALVHEAFLKLANTSWDSKGHFFIPAARAMRRILIDHARSKRALKRGDGVKRLNSFKLEGVAQPLEEPVFLELEEAIEGLAKVDQTKAKLVELKFFA